MGKQLAEAVTALTEAVDAVPDEAERDELKSQMAVLSATKLSISLLAEYEARGKLIAKLERRLAAARRTTRRLRADAVALRLDYDVMSSIIGRQQRLLDVANAREATQRSIAAAQAATEVQADDVP